MNDVPRWQAKFISEFYYETYHYLYPDVPHFSQLNNEQSFMLAALIYGDLLERWPILKDAQNYVRNGNKVYSYFMNVESQWDGMVGGKPLFPGTGHGDELEYVFGLTKDWRYPYHNNYLDPLDWEHDVTLFCERLGLN